MKVMIYIPGLGHGFLPMGSIENYAYRYCRVMQNNNPSYSNLLYEINEYNYGKSNDLVKVAQDKGKEAVRIYEYAYIDELIGTYETLQR